MMRMVDLIEKKKKGQALTDEEWHEMITLYVKGSIPDYQMSAFLMAVYFQGLDAHETAVLTYEMMHSGEVYDLSGIPGVKVDKHSTGGVGDKTSLVLCPMLAAAGLSVTKMSGRGLGHTGGTLDKLESIPGLSVEKNCEDFIEQVKDIHLAIIGQSASLVPADKMLYALRDVTATVDSIPLIASSIMSKKLAAGSDAILLDVKYGDGAFMQTWQQAVKLAKTMIAIGTHLGRDTRAVISNMSQPLGYAIGNILEVKEVIDTLRGHGPEDLITLCLNAGAILMVQAQKAESVEAARPILEKTLHDGSALAAFRAMVVAQGGDGRYIDEPERFAKARRVVDVCAPEDGYVLDLKARPLGLVAMKLGGGRAEKDDEIDYRVGVMLHKKIGDYVKKGDPLVSLHANDDVTAELKAAVLDAYLFSKQFVAKPTLIEKIVE